MSADLALTVEGESLGAVVLADQLVKVFVGLREKGYFFGVDVVTYQILPLLNNLVQIFEHVGSWWRH